MPLIRNATVIKRLGSTDPWFYRKPSTLRDDSDVRFERRSTQTPVFIARDIVLYRGDTPIRDFQKKVRKSHFEESESRGCPNNGLNCLIVFGLVRLDINFYRTDSCVASHSISLNCQKMKKMIIIIEK